MRAGGLKYQITIQSPIEKKSDFGSVEKEWKDTIVTRADVIWLNGARVKDINELLSTYKVEFRIRRYHNVNEKMRVLYAGSKYRIEAILPNDSKQMLTLVTEKINE